MGAEARMDGPEQPADTSVLVHTPQPGGALACCPRILMHRDYIPGACCFLNSSVTSPWPAQAKEA